MAEIRRENQLRLVVFPSIFRVSYISGGAGLKPPTVSCLFQPGFLEGWFQTNCETFLTETFQSRRCLKASFLGHHSFIHLCSLQGKGDDRSSKGEGQGDSNRFKGKSCHGVLHDRLTKWIKACLSKMEDLCSFFVLYIDPHDFVVFLWQRGNPLQCPFANHVEVWSPHSNYQPYPASMIVDVKMTMAMITVNGDDDNAGED